MDVLPSRRCSALAAAVILALVVVFSASIGYPAKADPEGMGANELRQRLIVKLKDQGFQRNALAQAILQRVSARLGRTLTPLRELGTGGLLVEFEPGGDAAEALTELAARADVEYAEPDLLLQALVTPNDTRYYEQWDYFENTGGMNLPAAWDITRGAGAVVAVLDTGVTPHTDLAANLLPGYDMISSAFIGNDGDGRDADARDPGDWTDAGQCGGSQPPVVKASSWHGTHVAGTVAAVTDNDAGVAGVAHQAKIVPVRVLGRCGGYTSDIADAILWAAGLSVSGSPVNPNRAQVINLSLGGSGSCSQTLQEAINRARAAGVTVVVAAGNSNTDAANSNPANCSGVVAVAATARSGGRAYYSNFGSAVDLAAPGGDMSDSQSDGILSQVNTGTAGPQGDGYAFYQGTSMAAPHVAGLAALLYSVNPSITPDQVETTLVSTARAFPSTCSGCGAGIADAAAALASLSQNSARAGLLENGVPRTNLAGSAGAELHYSLEVPAGAAANLTFRISGGSGDADLYVRFGAPPTTSSWDFRPYLNGNNETVAVNPARTGTYHVMVRGYSAFSRLTLSASFDTASAATACPTGYETFSGALSGPGGYAYQPGGNYYYSSRSGTHGALLNGPSNANFNLQLWKWSGSSWGTVASAQGPGSSETINYHGTSGYYIWRIDSASGGGDFTFCLARP